MAYIGRDIQYGVLDKQTLTGANGVKTEWTDLMHGVGSSSSLIVSVGGVVQEPDVAYTASGTTLTFTEAPETGDTVYVVYLGKELTVATFADNSVTTAKIVDANVTTAKIADTNVTDAKLAASGTMPAWDGSALTSLSANNMAAGGAFPAIDGSALTGIAGGNTPRWWVSNKLNQTITSGVATRVTGWSASASVSDGGGYSSSRFTVPTGQAGDYLIGSNLSFHDSSSNITQAYTKLYKNGSVVYGGYGVSFNSSTSSAVHWGDMAIMIITLAENDFIDVYGQCVGSGTIRIFTDDGANNNFSNFWGMKIG